MIVAPTAYRLWYLAKEHSTVPKLAHRASYLAQKYPSMNKMLIKVMEK